MSATMGKASVELFELSLQLQLSFQVQRTMSQPAREDINLKCPINIRSFGVVIMDD
jgi:hypothetical protein